MRQSLELKSQAELNYLSYKPLEIVLSESHEMYYSSEPFKAD